MTNISPGTAASCAIALSARNLVTSITRGLLNVAAILGCTACAFIPRTYYVPDLAADQLVYAKCAGYTPVTTRAKTILGGVPAFTSIGERDGRWYVEIYFTVPAGKTVWLMSDRDGYAAGPGQARGEGVFPKVSLIASPFWTSYINSALRDSLRAVLEPMVGERVIAKPDGRTPFGFDRNFWLAACIDPLPDKDLWLTLPAFTVNGKEFLIPEIHFERESGVAVSLRCG